MSKSKIKVMLIAFFDQKCLVHHEFVLQGETMNQHFYQQVLIHLYDRVRCSRRVMWSVRQLLVRKQTTALNHHPYSPDLAPCDFWLFPRLKIFFKRNSFFIFRRNQSLGDKGAEEPQRRGVFPGMAGSNAKVH